MPARELDTGKPTGAGATAPNATLAFVDLGVVAIAPPTLQSDRVGGGSPDVAAP